MDLEKFKSLASACGAYPLEIPSTRNSYGSPAKGKTNPGLAFQESWVTGGIIGGSCWDTDGSSKKARTAEDEPELSSLDEFLIKIYPDMPFLFYKTKILPLIQTEEYTDHEYYGNSTELRYKYVLVEQLYDLLVIKLELKGLQEHIKEHENSSFKSPKL